MLFIPSISSRLVHTIRQHMHSLVFTQLNYIEILKKLLHVSIVVGSSSGNPYLKLISYKLVI
jgi:hypothetical protein